MKTKDKIKAGILATALLGSGAVIDDTVIKRVQLESQDPMTKYEYRQLRENIGNKGSADDLDWNGLQLYVEVLNKEKDKCNGDMYLVNNKQDIRDLVKKFDEKGCP